jgi:hypothetical protein
MNKVSEKRSKRYVDPIKEGEAVRSLRGALLGMDPGEDVQLLLDMIEGETSFCEALDKLLLAIAEDQALEGGALQAAEALTARAERFARRAETARALIEQAMLVADLPKLERPTATLSLVRRPPKLDVAEEADIPAEFWKLGDPKLDKKALLAALKDGRTVPGACLSNCPPSLTIRTV